MVQKDVRKDVSENVRDDMRGNVTGNVETAGRAAAAAQWKQMFLYVMPLMAASLFQQLYTVVDAAIVGNFVGHVALGAIDSTSSVVRLLVNFFVGISTGSSIVIAQLWGAKMDKQVGDAVYVSYVASIVCGAVLTVLGLLLSAPLLALLNTPEENWDYAYVFVMIYFCGMIPMMTYNICASILRAVGDSRSPMVFVVVSCALNIGLDLLFVAVFEWGVAGAAWATVISELVSCVLSTIALMRYDGSCRLRLRGQRFDWVAFRKMLSLGLPTGIGSALYPLSNATVQWGINGLGSTVVTGWALVGKVDLFVWLVLDAFGVAATTFVAQCYGAGDMALARHSVKVCFVLTTVMVVPLCVVMVVWGQFLVSFFTDDAASIEVAGKTFEYLAPFYVTFVVVEVLSGAIRGVGETIWPMLITLVGTCLLRIAWMCLVFPRIATLLSVCAVYPVSWIATGIAFIVYWYRGKWRHRLDEPVGPASE